MIVLTTTKIVVDVMSVLKIADNADIAECLAAALTPRGMRENCSHNF
jgi:hypothetical protein